MSDEFTVREAKTEDLPGILRVQHNAFRRVALAFSIEPHRLPPLVESLEDLEALEAQGMRFFAAFSAEGQVVGAVRAEEHQGSVTIGRLVVDDGWQRKGVASAVMDALEAAYPSARVFTLFTGAEALAPLALYSKRGYEISRRDDSGPVELVWLEKPGPASSG